ncbi:hypothetical protein GmHk_14G041699 [Glycine max]|nr:hypothetical protein GmHk_14G041699 [Glycine max]
MVPYLDRVQISKFHIFRVLPNWFFPFPEVIATTYDHYNSRQTCGRDRGHSRDHGGGHGNEGTFKKTSYHQK